MPTGYAYIIEEKENLTLMGFAARCARAFGATLIYRDDPLEGADIFAEQEVDDYHKRAIRECQEELEYFANLSIKQHEEMRDKEYDDYKKQNEESLRDAKEKLKRYERMERMVSAWTPPTPEHENLKAFMLEQIEKSKPELSFYKDRESKPKKELNVWVREKNESLINDIAYHKKKYEEAVERTAERNQWLQELQKSLQEFEEKNNQADKKCIWKFESTDGLFSGCFVATENKILQALKKKLFYVDPVGSLVRIERSNFRLISDDPDKVSFFEENNMNSGFHPLMGLK